jgi:fatty acid desaturase
MNCEIIDDCRAQCGTLDALGTGRSFNLTKQEIVELSTIRPLLSCLHIAAEWAMILTTIYIYHRVRSPLFYLLAVAFLGARQHALLILMHDGVHYRLFRNRWLNDWITEILLAWPNLISARAYRRNHFAHHLYLNTDKDPDWTRKQGNPDWLFPKGWSHLLRLLLRDLSGLGAIGFLRTARSLSKDTCVGKGFSGLRYGFYLSLALILIWAGAVKLSILCWFIPMFTWLIFIFRVRGIAEHSAMQNHYNASASTRTTCASLIERIFLAPKNVNYHIEHHLYPSVPFYRLPQLHTLLLAKPGFRDAAHLTRTYWGVLQEAAGSQLHFFSASDAQGEFRSRSLRRKLRGT